MNPITKIFNEISETNLLLAILEMQQADKDGIIPEGGYVRKYAKETSKITGNSLSVDFLMVQMLLLKEAAYRWARTTPIEFINTI